MKSNRQHMKTIIRQICPTLLACLLSIASITANAAAVQATGISAQAAVLIDATSGQVLFEKNMTHQMYPASITKIMTGLVAMEQCSALEVVPVHDRAVELPPGSSHIALSAGERLLLDDAMYALMLPSANDAANAIAEHVSGSQSAFVELMNRRAAEIGAVNTHFTNAHGLPDSDHYTTAYDMALITREAIGNADFMRYFSAARHEMPATNISPERYFSNHQYMLLKGSYFYNADVIAGKVGYTHVSGHTMSTVAARGSRTLICVVMNTDRYGKFYDTQKLLELGFNAFEQFAATPSSGPLARPGTPGTGNLGGVYLPFEVLQTDKLPWFETLSGYAPPHPTPVTPAYLQLSSITLLPRRMWDYALIGFIGMLMAGTVALVVYFVTDEVRSNKAELRP